MRIGAVRGVTVRSCALSFQYRWGRGAGRWLVL